MNKYQSKMGVNMNFDIKSGVVQQFDIGFSRVNK